MDLTESIAPKSDQLNAEDLLTGPRTFTIEKVSAGNPEQPVNVHLVEFPGRPFRPSKTVRRIMVGAWGPDTSVYDGRRMTLYRDPEVRFGGMEVGGIRVSHMSHLKGGKPLKLALTTTRGKRAPFVVQPLPDNAPTQAPAQQQAPVDEPKITAQQESHLTKLLRAKGIAEADWLPGIATIIGRPVSSHTAMTADEWGAVINRLETLPDGGAATEGDEAQS